MTVTVDRDAERTTTTRRARDPRRMLILGRIRLVVIAADLPPGWWRSVRRSACPRSTCTASTAFGGSGPGGAASVGHAVGAARYRRIPARVQTLTDVASVTVTTSFPSTVTSRSRAHAGRVVRPTTGRKMLVDHTGYQFQPGRSGAKTCRARRAARYRRPDNRRRGRDGRGCLPAADLLAVASIQALDPTAISLVMNSGRVVRWGGPTRSADKARVLPILLHRQGTHIDVTDPDQPYRTGRPGRHLASLRLDSLGMASKQVKGNLEAAADGRTAGRSHPRVRDHRGAARAQRRGVRPGRGHDLSGAAPVGGVGPHQQFSRSGQRPAPPHVRLTAPGRRAFATQRKEWLGFVQSVAAVVGMAT